MLKKNKAAIMYRTKVDWKNNGIRRYIKRYVKGEVTLMVQIGNFHIGQADTATLPNLDIGEAYILSEHLYYRYICLENSTLYYKWANDTDLKSIIQIGMQYLQKEVDATEKQMDKYKVPQPTRSPRSVKVTASVNDNSLINDQLIFEQIRHGCIAAVEKNLRNAIAILNNDSLRVMFIDFVKEEMDIMLACCKYGKLKGWLPIYPSYKAD